MCIGRQFQLVDANCKTVLEIRHCENHQSLLASLSILFQVNTLNSIPASVRCHFDKLDSALSTVVCYNSKSGMRGNNAEIALLLRNFAGGLYSANGNKCALKGYKKHRFVLRIGIS